MTRQADVQNSMNNVASGSQVEKATELRKYDQTAVQENMAKLRAEVAQKKEAERQRAAEIAAVSVSDADVAVVASELDMDLAKAKLALQEKNGDLTAVLREAVGLRNVKAKK